MWSLEFDDDTALQLFQHPHIVISNEPTLRPDWNPQYFSSQNVAHQYGINEICVRWGYSWNDSPTNFGDGEDVGDVKGGIGVCAGGPEPGQILQLLRMECLQVMCTTHGALWKQPVRGAHLLLTETS